MAKFGGILQQMISMWKLVYTPHHKIEKGKNKKKTELATRVSFKKS